MILLTRRPFLLLEVLIAFIFIVGAFFPLIYPHFYIFQQQHRFIRKIEIDNAVNDFYASIVEQLQQNKIDWGAMEQGEDVPIGGQGLPFTGSYRIKLLKTKKNEKYELGLAELTLMIAPGKEDKKTKGESPLIYTYQIFVTRLYSKG